MAEPGLEQVGANLAQLRAIVAAAEETGADSVLLRAERGVSESAPLEVWLFSDAAEGIVGMIEVDPAGEVSELDE